MVRGGSTSKPAWFAAVKAFPPHFEPVSQTRPPKITYPEDRLREIFLKRNPQARRLPVNLSAPSIPERHIADRFVALQLQLMKEDALDEEAAYKAADRIICSEIIEANRRKKAGEDVGPLVDPSVSDEQARIYLASVRDSNRDKLLHAAFVNENNGK